MSQPHTIAKRRCRSNPKEALRSFGTSRMIPIPAFWVQLMRHFVSNEAFDGVPEDGEMARSSGFKPHVNSMTPCGPMKVITHTFRSINNLQKHAKID